MYKKKFLGNTIVDKILECQKHQKIRAITRNSTSTFSAFSSHILFGSNFQSKFLFTVHFSWCFRKASYFKTRGIIILLHLISYKLFPFFCFLRNNWYFHVFSSLISKRKGSFHIFNTVALFYFYKKTKKGFMISSVLWWINSF